MQLAFAFDVSRCSGCMACIVACLDQNDLPDAAHAFRHVSRFENSETNPPALSFLSVLSSLRRCSLRNGVPHQEHAKKGRGRHCHSQQGYLCRLSQLCAGLSFWRSPISRRSHGGQVRLLCGKNRGGTRSRLRASLPHEGAALWACGEIDRRNRQEGVCEYSEISRHRGRRNPRMSNRPARILIIGNGGAAACAVQAARSAGYTGEIHLLCAESQATFNPMLAPYYLAGRIAFERCFPFGRAFYQANEVTLHFGAMAEKLDPANRTCFLTGGGKIPYDYCLAASGASAVLPPVPGLGASPRVFALRTVSQTKVLGAALQDAREIIVLGASLVGTKLASILAQRGSAVTLVDIADHVLPTSAHPVSAALIEAALKKEGVRLALKRRLDFAEDFAKGIMLHFEDGGVLTGDVCVACTGVRANMDYLEGTEVIRTQGIHVDSRMSTNALCLFAAGDVAQGLNILSGTREVIGLWGTACNQGRVAGIGMAGGRSNYPGSFPQFVTTFSGLDFVSLGDMRKIGPEIQVRVWGDSSRNVERILLFDGEILAGANLINCNHGAAYIKAVITERLEWKKEPKRFGLSPFWIRENSFPTPLLAGGES